MNSKCKFENINTNIISTSPICAFNGFSDSMMISKLFTRNDYIPEQDGNIKFSMKNIAVINEMKGPIGKFVLDIIEDF